VGSALDLPSASWRFLPTCHHSEQQLSSSFGGRGTSLLLVQKRSTQEKTTPRFRALRTSCPQGSRAGCGVCRQSILGLTPNWFASMRTTLRADPPPARRCRGAPGRAARHPGAHSVRNRFAVAKAAEPRAKSPAASRTSQCCECLSSAKTGHSRTGILDPRTKHLEAPTLTGGTQTRQDFFVVAP
jgi:hypothetical protein